MKLGVVGAFFVLVVAGCGGGAGGVDSGTGGGDSQTAALARPLVNYRKALLSQFVGQYSGSCELLNGQPTEASLSLLSEGVASLVPGGSSSLMSNQIGIGFVRSLESNNPSAGFFASGIEFGEKYPHVTLDADTFKGGWLNVRVNEKWVSCKKVDGAIALMSKSVYQVAAQFIETEATRLKCVNGITRTDLGIQSYRIKNGMVEVMGESFSLLQGLKHEQVGVTGLDDANVEKTTLEYVAQFTGGGNLYLAYDAYGDLSAFLYQRGGDHNVTCGLAK